MTTLTLKTGLDWRMNRTAENPSAPMTPMWNSEVTLDLRWVSCVEPWLGHNREHYSSVRLAGGNANFVVDMPYEEFVERWMAVTGKTVSVRWSGEQTSDMWARAEKIADEELVRMYPEGQRSLAMKLQIATVHFRAMAFP